MEKFDVRKSKINGSGLFVTQSFTKGQFINYIRGPKICIRKYNSKISQRILNWIGTSKYTFINTDDSPFRYINHSCNPNVAIKGERTVYALKDIKPGIELVMDYSLTDAEEGWGVNNCGCKEINCRNYIGPITSLNKKTFQYYKPIISKKFQKIYLRQNLK